jgi:hypothetical protein
MLVLLAARATSHLSQYYTVASRPHGATCWCFWPQEPHRPCPRITQLLADRMAPHAGALGRKSNIALVAVLHSCQQTAKRQILALLAARATSLLSQNYTLATRPHGATCWRSWTQEPNRSCPRITQEPADRMASHAGVLGRESHIALVPVLHSCQQTEWRQMLVLFAARTTSHLSQNYSSQQPAWRHMLVILAARATSHLSLYYTVASRPNGATCWCSWPQEPHRPCPRITHLPADRMALHAGSLGRKSHIALVPVLHSCQQTA